MSDENNIPLENAPTTPQWETMDAGVFARFSATIKNILFHPVQFFKSFRADGDYLAPLLYVLLLYIIIIIFFIILYSPFPSLLVAGLLLGFIGAEVLNKMLFPLMIPSYLCIVISPLFIPLFLFVSAGIIHLLAILFGAASKPYKATFRVMAYLFTINLLLLIGGPLVLVICQAVYLTIALREVHHTTTFRAVCVVLPSTLLLLVMWNFIYFSPWLLEALFFSY